MNGTTKHHWRFEKMISLKEAGTLARELQGNDKRIVTVNGGFDLLHAGHLDILEEAKQQGDVLFVGLNSDASIKDGKGAGRPIVPEQERMALLAALVCVDYVVLIDEPYDSVHDVLLEAVRPDVHTNSSEYGPPEQWVDWSMMERHGVAGHVVERREGLATSDIVAKILSNTDS